MKWMLRTQGLRVPLPWLLFLITVIGTAAQPTADSPWLQAREPRAWHFPRDHGAHPEYQTEWWYFTGNLRDGHGDRYGYQLTLFRHGLNRHADTGTNPWLLRDIYIAHFAITDEGNKGFLFKERMSRAGPGLAGARTDGMDVWVLNCSARMTDTAVLLEAYDREMELSLTLTPVRPLILHGDRGLSRKGFAPGQASYYASFARLHTTGTIKPGPEKPAVGVSGTSWFDHEFGSNQLSSGQEGWDWFSLHLSDGRDLMLYIMRSTNVTDGEFSSGTLAAGDGTWRNLTRADFIVRVLKQWDSPLSGARYPGQWHILIPSAHIEIMVNPLIPNQELLTTQSTAIIYWEGAVRGEGTSEGEKITAEGYVELTGYAGSMGGLF